MGSRRGKPSYSKGGPVEVRQTEPAARRVTERASGTFEAKYLGVCRRCHETISPGDLVRFTPDDELVHARHTVADRTYEVCTQCFLTKPCECED